ncbi:MAG TPA: peptide-methionine (S)-S-oxide reductase MsrA [Pseudomonadales bacterium]
MMKTVMINAEQALPGRSQAMLPGNRHAVLGSPLSGPFPPSLERAVFGMGCFWGAERCFWTLPGVYSTAVGYSGGYTPNPTYQEVCTGLTGHNEVVLVLFDPAQIRYEQLLQVFWQSHNPTQGMRQGNDIGSQYRSGIYCSSEAQQQAALDSRERYRHCLAAAGYPAITTEIVMAGPFYYAEDYHQQYLAKKPGGYCGLGGTGVSCPL